MPPEIQAVVSPKIGFASHQNAVPVLRDLELSYPAGLETEELILELIADPPIIEQKIWRIAASRSGGSHHIEDRDVKLNASFLGNLAENVLGEVRFRLSDPNGELAAVSYPVEILARSHWGGCGSMSELLPAFCMPNDPAVDRILKAASDILRRAGKSAGIDGYESKSRARSWELGSAIWSAVAGLGLSYALPPASFEQLGQKVRTPGAILEGRVATCLDTTLLFASALEQAGLNALLILVDGHAMAGLWLQPQEFSQLVTEEAAALRKRIELQELIVFETTLATHQPAPAFSQAVEAGKRRLGDDEFRMAIDVRRARMQRIRPLALASGAEGETGSGDGETARGSTAEALEEAPALPGFDIEVVTDAVNGADRLVLWQRKLLDLTTRNRLLHVPDSSKGIALLCPDPAILEDRLAAGEKIRLAPLPDLEAGGRDAALYAQRNREDLHEEFAREVFSRGEVLSRLSKTRLEAELIDLYRKSRSDLDEGGANTLFLALGFLRWKKAASDPKAYRAPLILLPVKLERASAASGVKMAAHEDEPRFNLTLLELLRQDFGLSIPGLEGSLPTDGSGVDVASIWNTIRLAVKDIPGFEVSGELLLGTFSFAKYLMWKDLADRKEQLMLSPVVRHLLTGGQDSFEESDSYVAPEKLDQHFEPAEWFTPLPADSSQLAAVAASARGCNFVLDGPPGTGKSQTIANMIAQNLAQGRRVLFVAEKMAALEVVKRRLEEKGLGEFCLEVHSNKTSKIEILKQLDRAWELRDSLSADQWQREAAEVRRLRDRLNETVQLLHQEHPNGWTLHRAIGLVVRDANEATPRLQWPAGTRHDEAGIVAMRDIARRLDLNLSSFSAPLPRGFLMIDRRDWSNAWQDSVTSSASGTQAELDALMEAKKTLLEISQLPFEISGAETMNRFAAFVRLLMKACGSDLSFVFAADALAKIETGRRAVALLAEWQQRQQGLSAAYAESSIRNVPIARISEDWAVAGRKFWFFASLARKKVAQSLATVGGVATLPDVGRDLPLLAAMQGLLHQLDSVGVALAGMPGWAGISTDGRKFAATLDLAGEILTAISSQASSLQHLESLRGAVRALIVDANSMLAEGGQIGIATSRLEEILPRFISAEQNLRELCNIPPDQARDFQSLREIATAVQSHRQQLKEWCDWRRVRADAMAMDLSPLVQAIESGAVQPGRVPALFETAYARWFAATEIDAEPRLRNFVPAEHMSDIEAYRRADDKLSSLTVRYIRARLCAGIPDKNGVSKRDGFGILKYELQKQRRHKPLRQLATEMGEAMTRLAPCMLMSPLSIAQYLPPGQELFDLVIFDEASQIAPWDAIGSIARGKQVVIAGDPRQMPPTNFFNRSASSSEDDVEGDMESILDECLAAGVPRHSLTWHYRSRHESLIAFSNHRYYDSSLITFPAAVTRDSAVIWRKVDGVYARGSGRTNQAEAEAMVAEAVKRLTDPAFVAGRKSLAIVTLNADQQRLVEDLLDRERRQHPEIERFFKDDIPEPVKVKNLETVQGDERDLVILGIGFGPKEAGAPTMSMDFGPLNRDGGWRRLNVAVTRARQEMMVFTSFDPHMIDLNRTNARAVRDLKHFLEFAERGPPALAEAVQGSLGSYESPFEEAVARGLRDKGWQVVPQIGVSRFRIDLGIVHPDRPGDYLVGVECDGATYHSAATARDRDKVRSAVLESLGWTLLRIWSTEWWVDSARALQRLDDVIRALLAESRAAAEKVQPLIEEMPELVAADAQEEQWPLQEEVRLVASAAPPVEIPAEIVTLASLPPVSSPESYRIADFSSLVAVISAEKFYDAGYDAVLADLVRHVLTEEAPLAEGLLIQRIARAHGFQRAGQRIRERVLEIVEKDHQLRPDPLGGHFVWLAGSLPGEWGIYRLPTDGESPRSIEEIPFEELRAASLGASGEDVILEVARRLGIRRLSASARTRLEAALQLAAVS